MPSDRTGPGEDRVRGVVKFWREEKGWGVISSGALPPGRDAFAHFSVVERDGFRSLTEGEAVEFTFRAMRYESFDFVADSLRPIDDRQTPSANQSSPK